MLERISNKLNKAGIKHNVVRSTEPTLEDDMIEISGTNIHLQVDAFFCMPVVEKDGKFQMHFDIDTVEGCIKFIQGDK